MLKTVLYLYYMFTYVYPSATIYHQSISWDLPSTFLTFLTYDQVKRHNAGRFPFFVPALVFHAWAIDGLLGLAWAASQGREGLSALCLGPKGTVVDGVVERLKFFFFFG